MSNTINPSLTSIDTSLFAQYAAGTANDAGKVTQKLVSEVATLLAGAGISAVGPTNGTATNGANAIGGDEPYAPVALEETEEEIQITSEDTEKIIALLQAETDKEQLKQLKDALASKKGQLATAQKTQIEKIDKSIEEAKKAEEANRWKRALGIFGAIFAVFAAVVVTVFTGGAAAGFAIAGAVLAVANVVMSETGLTDKIVESMKDSIRADHPEWSKAECEAAAQARFGAMMLVLSAICLVGSIASGGATAASNLAKVFSTVSKAVGGLSLAANTGVNIASTVLNKNSSDASAEATEFDKVLRKLQRAMEEDEEAINAILEQLNNVYVGIPELLESSTNTSNEILNSTMNMA